MARRKRSHRHHGNQRRKSQFINPVKAGLALGIFEGITLMFLVFINLLLILFKGQNYSFGLSIINFIGTVFKGYEVGFLGMILGGIWGFVDGFIGGYVFAYIWNWLGCKGFN